MGLVSDAGGYDFAPDLFMTWRETIVVRDPRFLAKEGSDLNQWIECKDEAFHERSRLTHS